MPKIPDALQAIIDALRAPKSQVQPGVDQATKDKWKMEQDFFVHGKPPGEQ